MATGQAALAIGVVFSLLAVIIFKFGKPAQAGGAWIGRLARGVGTRRIGLVESRVLPGGCRLHLVEVDGKGFLLAQTGASCTPVSSWTVAAREGIR